MEDLTPEQFDIKHAPAPFYHLVELRQWEVANGLRGLTVKVRSLWHMCRCQESRMNLRALMFIEKTRESLLRDPGATEAIKPIKPIKLETCIESGKNPVFVRVPNGTSCLLLC